MPEFTHLHVHTQYSILDGAASIPSLIERTVQLGMKALAITDHGNMYGVLQFIDEAEKAGIKPIIGCEMYVAPGSRFERKGKEDRSGHHLILIARNYTGYQNLVKLCSLGYREGYYYTPRIDKELLRQYHDGLIASSACLGGELPETIMTHGTARAVTLIREYQEIFGDNYYLEMMDHGLPEQKQVNQALYELSQLTGVKIIATNDVHFVRSEDFEAHRILICLNTGRDLDDLQSMHYTGQEYLKSPEEMEALFASFPDAVTNTQEIVDKVEKYKVKRSQYLLPHYPLPEGFENEFDYLQHLTLQGASKLYGEITPEIQQRIDFELSTIQRMGLSGYFLIVADFIREARNMGVIVGPGRGSAAGSIVSYCLQITRIDPIKYDLLFERFLNPDRISMPDIDVDFDDEGRDKVLKYVIEKYGENKVAQIVTFGTMAARSAIRDVARVLKLPLPDADRIAKLVPEKPGITLDQAIRSVPELQDMLNGENETIRKTIQYARVLEGSNRHTGTHACGVIIAPDDLINYVPLSRAKDNDLLVTQYEGSLVEKIGLLKMDFLGLKTLSIIKDALQIIYDRHGIQIDIDEIPLDDEKTLDLYKRGETIGTFQFESEGMRMYLRDLKPTSFEDLIAMNALYRPGPMEYINTYIRRKHGKEEITYPLPALKPILNYTYGIMVYQEQIMQVAQKIAGFSLALADRLRKVMGKKIKEELPELRELFIDGAVKNGYSAQEANQLFDIMQEFAKYGFNRSHAAAYSFIAYQTAYIKAHYPSEYMAAVLTHNLSDIKKISFFTDECRRMGIEVLGPDINESDVNFSVNKKGQIRFGLAAIKGVGEAGMGDIINERRKNGPFSDIFDFVKRINLRSVNRRSLEAMIYAGTFDCFEEIHRAQYFVVDKTDETIFLEKLLRFAASYQSRINTVQHSLFGDQDALVVPNIEIPQCSRWPKIYQLKLEKEVTGFYMTGHPLDDHKLVLETFCNTTLSGLREESEKTHFRELVFGGIVTSVTERIGKNGKQYCNFTLEDFEDQYSFILFSEDYLRYKHLLVEGTTVLVKGIFQQRYNREDRNDLKINFMCLLAEAMDKLTNSVSLFLTLDTINNSLVNHIYKLIKEHKGNCPFTIHVYDPDENMSVSLPSLKYRVECSTFIRSLETLEGVTFKLK